MHGARATIAEMRRLALALVCLLALGAPGLARAGEQTLTFRSAPISIESFGVQQQVLFVPSPSVDGYITSMDATVIDANGNPEPASHTMLHHIVFMKLGAPDYTCRTLPVQRFYAAGEEHSQIALPSGYGYPNKGSDHWAMLYMLMNHHALASTVWIEYRVHYVTDEQLTAVKPVWLDVRDCGSSEFDVPGTGGPGSTFTEKWDFTMPEGGRIVAAGGHLHGGAVGLDVTDTTCGRSLYSSLPTWGGAPVFPVMHEPGPTHMSSLTSSEGIPFAAGDTLRLSATYDDSRPHVRAMGISIAYILPGQVSGCPPLPAVAPDSESHPGPAPVTVLPLLKQPTGRLAKNITTTQVGDYVFAAQRVSIARGTMFTWNFVGAVPHDVTLATGPVGFSSPHMKSGAFSYTFTRPGVYKLFCSLHPTRMTQVVTVR